MDTYKMITEKLSYKMCNILLIIVNCLVYVPVSGVSDIFHVKSKVTFFPDSLSEYFGYTVVLTSSSILIGAPKAKSRVNDTISPGLVFNCRLTDLNKGNVTCYPLGMDDDGHDRSIRRVVTVKDFFRNDMWFGASIASLPTGKLLACAPRWADPYKDKHLLANGACYLETMKRGLTLTPLKDQRRLAFLTDGKRKEYGEYGTHLNFYAYGQAGMAMKVTEMDSIIIGAPGLMQWTGGIVDYRFSPDPNSVFFSKMPISNLYFTTELGPDDYFGYSVESGIFEVNGSTLYVAGAPRSKMGFGQVLIFEPATQEILPLRIRTKLGGPQLGSYFGATLCCTDINNDGRADLLVGAPNHVRKDGGLPFDQGAVFVYLTDGEGENLTLAEAGYVSGSGSSGSRFGSAIANLGDLDGDGCKDVAIGAPWENEGTGVVYIYKGSSKGLLDKHIQRIVAESGRGFGISISKAVDVDGNNCNDLAIGAHKSNTAYLYRCVPTIQVNAVIKVPGAMNLPQNATNFTAMFCITVPAMQLWPHVKIDLKARIVIDSEADGQRAKISGDSEYTLTAKPGNDVCDEQVVEVKPTADLSKPISMKFELIPVIEDSPVFNKSVARLSEDSTLHSSFLIQLIRDCGEDLICTPWLVMTLEPLNRQYIPGIQDRLGVIVLIINKEEPAYGAKVKLTLPLPPKRIPSECSLNLNTTEHENLTTDIKMICEIPGPLSRGESITWVIELEYNLKIVETQELIIVAELADLLYKRNISEEAVKEVSIKVIPKADFQVSGKPLPNTTVTVSREKLDEVALVKFVHLYEITNFGPSDWSQLEASIEVHENVTLSKNITGCEDKLKDTRIHCIWSVAANVSLPVKVELRFDLEKYGEWFNEVTIFNATSNLTLHLQSNISSNITTTLILEPASSICPYIVGCIAGLLHLALIVYVLYKYGFFSRTSREELKRLQESPEELACASRSSPVIADESTLELLDDDSDLGSEFDR